MHPNAATDADSYRPELIADDEPRYLRRQKPVEIRRKKFSGRGWPFYRRLLVLTLRKSKPATGDKTATPARKISCGGFQPVFAGVGTVARRRRSARAGKNRHPPPPHSDAWPLRVPNHHLVLQLDAVRLLYAFAHIGDQRQHVSGGSFACVHEEIGVAIADARVADGQPFESELVNHAACGCARRIFEDAAGAFLAK